MLMVARTLRVAWADRKRARAESQLRGGQFWNLILAAGLGVVTVGFAAFGGFGGLPTLDAAASASPAPQDKPCSNRTGTLTLERTAPTTITWTYTPPGTATGGTVRLSVRVDGHLAGPTSNREPTGTLTDLPIHPVAVHVEGTGPAGRVYLTCTG
ncbi:hypothetical protein AB0M43_24090 [Longispora sp. NPDC051575]|uniref:hypothetical protein n=1 Tax=Longispora sp. NPDC051575 TaxID=3154943 RepID=UPI0034460C0E